MSAPLAPGGRAGGFTDPDIAEAELTNARLASVPSATGKRTGAQTGTQTGTGSDPQAGTGTRTGMTGGTRAGAASRTRTDPGAGGRTEPTEQSIGSLIAEVADDVSRLFRQEVELAKAELKAEATKAGKAAGMLGGAGFAGYMVALFASLALMFALDAIMPAGWAALIVTVLWGIAAAILFVVGRNRMKTVSPMPQQTVETLKEDAQWLRNPMK